MPLVHPALLGLTTALPDVPGPAGLALPACAPGDAAAACGDSVTGDSATGDSATGPVGLAQLLAGGSLAADVLRDEGESLDLATLTELAGRLAATERLWRPIVRHDAAKRWYTRLLLTGVVEVWLIGWSPGQHTAVHDHGGALGALAVADGAVEEDVHAPHGGSWEPRATRRHAQGRVVGFGADHVHRVINRTAVVATTVHAYSPPEVPLRYANADGSVAVPAAAAAQLTTGLLAPTAQRRVAATAAR
ncbi:cysteine dioxygenase family protein [Frankia sp. AgB1.9]|uniref:cysteine dioxygenase n=1 Tax=unclassified Frankia TaxID=2632575 RepID=UPI0019319CBF|nr:MULTISPECIES: cysteine dioxygenase family protein [unclassified Frankia]MBL7490251.1 cysteine dioxygenase family protein [Frankia sp. AgW1.1]MBL7551505.1 cysteine dioxygenase family protein [Frankia sp. AgB1.9]MBL7620899.1 cysteine dioxygenase family protein [Frankia sp. AgB1.8]